MLEKSQKLVKLFLAVMWKAELPSKVLKIFIEKIWEQAKY